jgi:hypothetical protein
MVDIALDLAPADVGLASYKDLLTINNDLALTSDGYPAGSIPAAATNPVLQDIIQRLRFFLGEWFLDNTQGVPYFQQILIKNPDQSKVDAIFSNIIMGTPGVQTLTSYSFAIDTTNRIFSVAFRCTSTSGPINYSGNIAPVTGGNF